MYMDVFENVYIQFACNAYYIQPSKSRVQEL